MATCTTILQRQPLTCNAHHQRVCCGATSSIASVTTYPEACTLSSQRRQAPRQQQVGYVADQQHQPNDSWSEAPVLSTRGCRDSELLLAPSGAASILDSNEGHSPRLSVGARLQPEAVLLPPTFDSEALPSDNARSSHSHIQGACQQLPVPNHSSHHQRHRASHLSRSAPQHTTNGRSPNAQRMDQTSGQPPDEAATLPAAAAPKPVSSTHSAPSLPSNPQSQFFDSDGQAETTLPYLDAASRSAGEASTSERWATSAAAAGTATQMARRTDRGKSRRGAGGPSARNPKGGSGAIAQQHQHSTTADSNASPLSAARRDVSRAGTITNCWNGHNASPASTGSEDGPSSDGRTRLGENNLANVGPPSAAVVTHGDPPLPNEVSKPTGTPQRSTGTTAPRSHAPASTASSPPGLPPGWRRPRGHSPAEHQQIRLEAEAARRALQPRSPTLADLRLTARVSRATHWRELLALMSQHRQRHEQRAARRAVSLERWRRRLLARRLQQQHQQAAAASGGQPQPVGTGLEGGQGQEQQQQQLLRQLEEHDTLGDVMSPAAATLGLPGAKATAGLYWGGRLSRKPQQPPTPVYSLPFTPQHVCAMLHRICVLQTAGGRVASSALEARQLRGLVEALARMAAALLPSPGMGMRDVVGVFHSLVKLRHPLRKDTSIAFMTAARKRFSERPPAPLPPRRKGGAARKQHAAGRREIPAAPTPLSYTAHDLAQLMWAVANCGMKGLRSDWASSYGSALLQVVHELTPQGVSLVLHGMARLRSPPSQELLAALCRRLAALTAADPTNPPSAPSGPSSPTSPSSISSPCSLEPRGGIVAAALEPRGGLAEECTTRAAVAGALAAGELHTEQERAAGEGGLRSGPHGVAEESGTVPHDGRLGAKGRSKQRKGSIAVQQTGQLDPDSHLASEHHPHQHHDYQRPGQAPAAASEGCGATGHERSAQHGAAVNGNLGAGGDGCKSAAAPLGGSRPHSGGAAVVRSMDVSLSLWALATLRVHPDAACPELRLLPVLEAFTLPRLADFPPQELSNTVWALARLQYRPADDWLQRLYDTLAAQLDELPPQTVATVLYGLATLEVTPPATWLEAVLAAAASDGCGGGGGSGMVRYCPQSLALMIHSVARMGYRPQDAWLAAFHWALETQPGQLDPRVRDKVREAYRLLGYRPGSGAQQPQPHRQHQHQHRQHYQQQQQVQSRGGKASVAEDGEGAGAAGVMAAPSRWWSVGVAAGVAGAGAGAGGPQHRQGGHQQWQRQGGQGEGQGWARVQGQGTRGRRGAGREASWEADGGNGVDGEEEVGVQVLARPSRFV